MKIQVYIRKSRPWYKKNRLIIAGYSVGSMWVELSKSAGSDAERLCPCCRARIKMFPKSRFTIPNPKKYRDMASSEDEYTFVSSDFKQFCQQNGYDKLEFTAIKTKGFYYLDKSKLPMVRLEHYIHPDVHQCFYCGTTDVVGTPIVIKRSGIVDGDDFMVRTDIDDLSGPHGAPDLIIGSRTKEKMEAFGLKNLYFEPVYFYDYGHE